MSDDPSKKDDSSQAVQATAATTQDQPAPTASAPRIGNFPRFIDAPAAGDVPDVVIAEQAQLQEQGHLLIYVGATWCEPCQRFHEAVNAGKLDSDLQGFRFLAFDMDRDRDRLMKAGYISKLIPLFVIPGTDGRSSGKQIEGSIVGPGSPHQITPRLLALVSK